MLNLTLEKQIKPTNKILVLLKTNEYKDINLDGTNAKSIIPVQ